MRRRVVVTGIGCVTPIGNTIAELKSSLYSGHVGVGKLTLFDASRFPVRIAAEVRDWDLSRVGEDPRRWKHCPRQTSFAIGAGLQAARHAGIRDGRIDSQRFGVYLGCGEPFEDFGAFTASIHDSRESSEQESDSFMRCVCSILIRNESSSRTCRRFIWAACWTRRGRS
jgi:3-oxoacyl-[acyl-carrier-protein] synthase II